MIGSTAVTMIFGIPLFVIGIPASLIPVYVWVRFARTPKGRR
jgi:hypothetical protein